MKKALLIAATLIGLLTMGMALVALMGILIIRQANPTAASVASLLVLLLPVFGLAWFAPRRQVLGLILGSILWPLMVLAGFPLFFPDERAEALDTGIVLLLHPLGLDLDAPLRTAMIRHLDRALLQSGGQRPPPMAPQKVTDPPMPPPAILPFQEDMVILPYEGEGHSLRVPITLDGPHGQSTETYVLFDTGATFTSLTARTLEEAGYRVSAQSPLISANTANGEVQNQVVTVDRLWVGGLEVSNVTVAVCDACSDGKDYSGLLGLNVSGRFLVTLDTARREMILQPRAGNNSQTLDIRPWLDIRGNASIWPDGRTEVTLTATNRSDRPVRTASVEVRCAQGTFLGRLVDIPPHETISQTVSIPRAASCETYTLDLTEAAW